ncbi:MAG: aminoglycoside phosphotransferase family protein [Actinomycetota bacterium]|nr:aminoglycoside phosphotransferase family protein [Actinomycetota bacterium]
MDAPGRTVTLVLCTTGGRLLGALPPLAVARPWWPEAGDVVAAARETFGVEVTVLRLLTERPPPPEQGGAVSYLAQVREPPDRPLQPWDGDDPTTDAPRRLPWARPGGPDADLAWADAVLADRGSPRTGPAEQVRTWNLSSLWRLPTGAGWVWLKVVPPFFAHEGAVLRRLAGASVPEVLAAADGRILMAEVAGADQYDAPLPFLLAMVALLVDLQSQWLGRSAELLSLGLPDWRAQPLTELAADVVRRNAADLDPDTMTALEGLLGALPRRWAAIADCGLGDSFVHGDFHPGNVRGNADRLVLLDWGDCGVGHPLLDDPAFTSRLSDRDRASVRAHWHGLWRAAVPGSDPALAARLLAPVAALRQAVIYQHFLDAIEDSERVYHVHDPVIWLRRTAALDHAGYSGPPRTRSTP